MSERETDNSSLMEDDDDVDYITTTTDDEHNGVNDLAGGDQRLEEDEINASEDESHQEKNGTDQSELQQEKNSATEDEIYREDDSFGETYMKNGIHESESSSMEISREDVPSSSADENICDGPSSGNWENRASGRRKQVTPKKRNGQCNNETEGSKVENQCIRSITNKEMLLSMMYDDEDFAHVAKSAAKEMLEKKAAKTPPPSKRAASPKESPAPKKAAAPKKVPAPKKTAAPKKEPTQKKARRTYTRKIPSTRKPKSKVPAKTTPMDAQTTDQKETGTEVSEEASFANENGEVVSKDQPAMSLKIICTPFNPKITESNISENGDPITPVLVTPKQRKLLEKKFLPKSPTKKASPRKTKTSPKNNSNNRKVSPKTEPRSEIDNQSVHVAVKQEKATRGKRKRKASVEYLVDFMNDSDNDVELDFSEDEYLPSKDEGVYDKDEIEGRKKLRVSFSGLDHEDKVTEQKPKSSTFKFLLNASRKTKAKPEKPKPVAKAKESKPTAKPRVNQKRPSKVKSPRKKRLKIKTQAMEDNDEDSQKEDAQDMPLLSPSKGRVKRRKRKIRISPKKTYLDNVNDYYTTGEEDFGMTTGTEDEGAGKTKTQRRKRRRYGEPYSVTGSWYIAQGYLFDITNLLEKFSKLDSWRFKDFANCWRELNFSLVYRGRQNFKELLEFSEEVALLTKRFMMPPHDVKYRIGSLYTMYGLYYKHPFRHFFKIRLILEEYEHLLKLIQPFRTNFENPDPAFIFRKLEVDGAISHVASSLEMCIDFYNAEREAVDIKYESQRLANSSSIVTALSYDYLEDDNKLLKQYHDIKIKMTGDGKEPEKSLSFVEPGTASEIKKQVKNLKEETLTILRLNDPPASKIDPPADDKSLSAIGARRAEIIAKAVKSDMGSEYLKKKCFRETSKLILTTPVKEKQGLPRQGLSKENESSMSNVDVRDFMKVPTKDTLNIPLKPVRRSQRKVPHKFIKKRTEDDEDEREEGVDDDLQSDAEESVMQASSSSLMEDKTLNDAPLSDGLEMLSQVPKMAPKPKRSREPARKIALSRALEQASNDQTLTDIQVLRRKMREQDLLAKRLKRRQLKPGYEPTKPMVPDSNTEEPSTAVIELPPEETSMIIPIKMEREASQSLTEFGLNGTDDTLSEMLLLSDLREKRLGDNQTEERIITLNIHFKGENVDEIHNFNISTTNWMSIQTNKRKYDRLKKKLISTILPEYIRQSIEQGNQIDVDISTQGDKDGMVEPSPKSALPSVESNTKKSASPSKPNQNLQRVDANHGFSNHRHLISPKKEKPDYLSPQKNQCMTSPGETSDVIKELHEIWGPDEGDDYEIKPVGKGYDISPQDTASHCSSRAQIMRIPLLKESPVDIDNRRVYSGEESYVDLVTDVDDFEDESEPIILTPRKPDDRYGIRGLHFKDNFMQPLQKTNMQMHVPGIPTSSMTVHGGNSLNVRNVVEPVVPAMPLYRRGNQLLMSPSQGFMSSTPLHRPVLFNSPSIVSSVSPMVVPVSAVQSRPVYSHGRGVLHPVYRAPNPQHMYPLVRQPSTSSQLTAPRFPGSVSVRQLTPGSTTLRVSRESGIVTPVAHAHHPDLGSLEGLRPLPNAGGSKFVKVKINDKSVFVPADRVLTSATKINYLSEMSKEGDGKLSQPNPPEQMVQPVVGQRPDDPSIGTRNYRYDPRISTGNYRPNVPSVSTTESYRPNDPRISTGNYRPNVPSVSTTESYRPNDPSSSTGNYRPDPIISTSHYRPDIPGVSTGNYSAVESAKPASDMHWLNSSSSSVVMTPVPHVEREESVRSESSNSSWMSSDSKGTSVSGNSSTRVCSFLFSSKYKALSGMMKDNAIGQATGTPVVPKKPNVTFILKHSLVPKRKSM